MIREPYNLNPYNSTIDTSKVNNFSFTFSGDELGSWNIEIAKNNTSPEIVYTSKEFVPSDVGYEHIYDGDIVEGITLPSTIAHNQEDDGLLRRLYDIVGYPYNASVVRLAVNDINDLGKIKGCSSDGYLVATTYSLGRENENVTILGYDENGVAIGSEVTNGTYNFLGYLLTVKANSNIASGQKVQIEGNTFTIGDIEDTQDGYYELMITNGTGSFSGDAAIVTFDTLASADLTELKVKLAPKQDLHGYANPWPSGGGKNLFHITASSSSGNNVTWTILDEDTFTLDTNGQTSTAFAGKYLGTVNLEGGVSYYLHAFASSFPPGMSAYIYSGEIIGGSDTGSGITVTAPSTGSYSVYCALSGGKSASNVVVQMMVCKASETATSYAPYSNICPISGHTDADVTRTGKNLCYAVLQHPVAIYAQGDSTAECIIISGSGTSLLFRCKAGQTYIISGITGRDRALVGFFDEEPEVNDVGLRLDIPNSKITTDGYYFTAIRDGYAACYLAKSLIDTSTAQIELGSTASEYQPYVGTTYATSLGQTVYGGTLDMVSGVLTVDSRYLTVSDFRGWNGSSVSAGGLHWVNVPQTYPAGVNDDTSTNVCSHARYTSNPNVGWGSKTPIYTVNSGGFPARIYVASASLADFRTEYATLQAVYKLAEPQTYQLTPQQIKTLVGTNNVWASSGQIVNIKFTYETN